MMWGLGVTHLRARSSVSMQARIGNFTRELFELFGRIFRGSIAEICRDSDLLGWAGALIFAYRTYTCLIRPHISSVSPLIWPVSPLISPTRPTRPRRIHKGTYGCISGLTGLTCGLTRHVYTYMWSYAA